MRKALEAGDSGEGEGFEVELVAVDAAAPEGVVDHALGGAVGPPVAAASRLSSRAATVVVSGRQLRGMSTTVVKPPAAAARVAVAKPSQSVRPGSLMWVWASTRPGRRAREPRSSSGEMREARDAEGELGWTAVMMPSSMTTVASCSPCGVMTRRERRACTMMLITAGNRG